MKPIIQMDRNGNGLSGRQQCPIRQAWALRFGIQAKHCPRDLPDELLAQLSYCRSDEARRLLLGVSR